MDRGDDDVEFGENIVVQVEAAVLEDVDFDAGEDANSAHCGIRGADFANLLARALFIHSVGDGDGFAVIGDGDVLVADRASRLRPSPRWNACRRSRWCASAGRRACRRVR